MKNLYQQYSGLTIFLIASVFMWSLVLLGSSVVYGQKAKDSVKVFAHRGGKLEFDENTVAAFKASYEKGLRGFETDIRLTKDNQLVISHDSKLKRIFGIEGSIEQMTLKELKELRTENGNTIPTLDEVLEFFNSKPGLYVEFEMKTSDPSYEQKVIERYVDAIYAKVFSNRPPTSDYVLTSFDKRPLIYVKSKYPATPMLFIKNEGLSQSVLDEAKALGINRVGCRIEGTSKAMVQKAKEQGFIVSLWPGLSIDGFLLGVSLGSDYLCTDVPVALYEWIEKNAPWIHLR